MTWNVHGAVGLDGRRLPSRQLALLRQLDADCIALQEFVDLPTPDGRRLLAHWAEGLGMEARYAGCFDRGGQHFGNALFSRFPIREHTCHDMTAPGGRRRVALDAVLDADGQPVHVVVVHCAVLEKARALQRATILDLARRQAGIVTVLLGDFNEWRGWSTAFPELREAFAGSHPLATYPAAAPLFPLDRIWVSPPGSLKASTVHRQGHARYASDHLPVVATLRLPAEAAGDAAAGTGRNSNVPTQKSNAGSAPGPTRRP